MSEFNPYLDEVNNQALFNMMANLVENEYGWQRDIISENFSKVECHRISDRLVDQHQINLNGIEVGIKIVNLYLIFFLLILYLIIYILI